MDGRRICHAMCGTVVDSPGTFPIRNTGEH
jgi:hypothetical protein